MAKPTIIKTPAPPAAKQVQLPVIDNPSAPDFYADDAIGFLLANNTLRITLASVKADRTKSPNANSCVVTGRLVLPIQAAQKLHNMLGTVLEKMKSQNADRNIDKIKILQ